MKRESFDEPERTRRTFSLLFPFVKKKKKKGGGEGEIRRGGRGTRVFGGKP